MTATQVMQKIRKVARKLSYSVTELPQKGSHVKVTVNDHCKTTVSHHPGEMPKGDLRLIEGQLEHCLGENWMTAPKKGTKP
jgi:predicted RNA binding protein YcfA (HicA-like mRNA interferase family)